MIATLIILGVVLCALLLTRWFVDPESPIRILDRPNERSLHTTPTPRTGGIAIVAAAFSGMAAQMLLGASGAFPWQLLAGAALVAGVSLLDDLFGLSQIVRLLIQLCAALLLIQDGFVFEGDWLPGHPLAVSAPLVAVATVLITLWLTNLYNFMDGMDGFAGGMAVFGFGALAVLGWRQGDILFALSALTIAGAAAGFLWFNFPPARIFMGDTGSTTLGFLVAGFAIWGSRNAGIPLWVTLVIFSPFVVDATVTLVRRALRGEPVWRAHRSHYYQRLVQLGWGHRRTVLAEYAAMGVSIVLGTIAAQSDKSVQFGVLALVAAGYLAAAITIHKLERRHNGNGKNQ